MKGGSRTGWFFPKPNERGQTVEKVRFLVGRPGGCADPPQRLPARLSLLGRVLPIRLKAPPLQGHSLEQFGASFGLGRTRCCHASLCRAGAYAYSMRIRRIQDNIVIVGLPDAPFSGYEISGPTVCRGRLCGFVRPGAFEARPGNGIGRSLRRIFRR